jgi:hypothetical protein
LLTGSLALRLEQATACDGGNVAVFECDGREPLLPPFERFLDAGLIGAEPSLSDEVVNCSLACDETHDGHWPDSNAALDQFGELWALAGKPLGIGGAASEPEDQLVEEENHCIIAE